MKAAVVCLLALAAAISTRCAIAADSASPRAVQDYLLGERLARYGAANNDVLALVMAARIMQAADSAGPASVTQLAPPTGGAPLAAMSVKARIAALLADATERAAGNPVAL